MDDAVRAALWSAAETIAKGSGETVDTVMTRLSVSADAPPLPAPKVAAADRNGAVLAVGNAVLIPALVVALGGDIIVVELRDPMPAQKLTLEAALAVRDTA